MSQAPVPPQVPPPPPPVDDRCYRHPDVVTGVHCTRCGRAICIDCMIPAPVGHQCPECVREARQEFHRPGRRVATGPTTGFTLTNALIALLIGVYVLEVAAAGAQALVRGPSALQLINLGASIGIAELPREGLVGIAVGQEWRLFTSMFLHAGIFHLLMNCYALFLFGNIVEQEFGRIRFVTLYLVSGLAAGAFSYAFGVPFVAGVGASGAIFGVFGAFLGVSYRRRHMAFYAARLRSALMLIAINVVIGLTVPSIDWRAHLGGLVVGFAGGFAAEGFGRGKVKAVQFGVVMAVMLGAAVVLTVWRTQQIREMFGL